jgi:hypothetical protein
MTEHDVLVRWIAELLAREPRQLVAYYPADPDAPPRLFTGNPPKDRDGNYLVMKAT